MRSMGCECSKTNSRDAEYKACSITWASASLSPCRVDGIVGLQVIVNCNVFRDVMCGNENLQVPLIRLSDLRRVTRPQPPRQGA